MSPPGYGRSASDCRCCICFRTENGGGHGGSDKNLFCGHCEGFSFPSSRSSFLEFKEYKRLRRIVTASAKGFTIGAGIKGGLAFFSLLSRFARRKRNARIEKNNEAIATAIKETLRYGFFLGTFAGTFVSVDELISALGGHRKTAKWRSLLAGAIAGHSILLTGLDTQHTSLAIYILMRAMVLASRCGIKSKRFGRICKPLTWAYGDIFLMCLSSSQILSAYILKQDSLPPSYKSFLNKHSGKDLLILQGIKEIASGMAFSNLKAIEDYYKTNGIDIKLDPEMKVPCSIIHGHQSCAMHLVSFLVQAYKRAVPVYLPVYLIPALLVHRQDLLKRSFVLDLFSASNALHNSGKGSTWYCPIKPVFICVLFICLDVELHFVQNFPKMQHPTGGNGNGTFPAGLALAIEKKSRRIEISLYCLARAIESFFTCMADAGYLPSSKRFKRADVVIFSLSTSIIMYCYEQEREVFRSKYLNVLDWVFGVPPTPGETLRYKINPKADE
ncbi:hypothetical protein RJ641_031665 [Dillenia turbinata]|uniref:Transmembrane protein 135 N-terminal domain-containing protein n=1 Tax=Dillenia turbinata TaxID=194707 RepID=A0AAN8W317_9MAGN